MPKTPAPVQTLDALLDDEWRAALFDRLANEDNDATATADDVAALLATPIDSAVGRVIAVAALAFAQLQLLDVERDDLKTIRAALADTFVVWYFG